MESGAMFMKEMGDYFRHFFRPAVRCELGTLPNQVLERRIARALLQIT
jgi:hypothetical protein